MLWIGRVVLLRRRRTGGSAGIRRSRCRRRIASCSGQGNVDFLLGEVLASQERDAVLDGRRCDAGILQDCGQLALVFGVGVIE
jgi:hypothetical protein